VTGLLIEDEEPRAESSGDFSQSLLSQRLL